MEIRHTKPADMDAVLALYDAARCFMAENGNPDQWVNGYPGADQLSLDMASGGSYVCVDGSAIVGTFYFALGDEPNYHRIDGGSWLNDRPMALSIASLQRPEPGELPVFAWHGALLSAVISALIPTGIISPCKKR